MKRSVFHNSELRRAALSFPHTWFYRKVLSRTPPWRKTTQYASLTCVIGIFSFRRSKLRFCLRTFPLSRSSFWVPAYPRSHEKRFHVRFSCVKIGHRYASLTCFIGILLPSSKMITLHLVWPVFILPSLTMVYGEYRSVPHTGFSERRFHGRLSIKEELHGYASLTLVHWTCPSFTDVGKSLGLAPARSSFCVV